MADQRDVAKLSEEFQEALVNFLADIVALPSESCHEQRVAERIAMEMTTLGYDEVFIDPMGNPIGRIGSGSRKLLLDSHIDTVGVGDIEAWPRDPFTAVVRDGIMYGRGTSDNKGGMAAMVYGGAMLKRLGVPRDVSVYVVGTVQEEDCDGLAMEYILTHTVPGVQAVILGEATGLQVYRGHRGRMEIMVTATGRSCHASAPERGVNAVYKLGPSIPAIEQLNEQLAHDEFLGKGTIALTKIECRTGSLNTVPDRCVIYLDRRLTVGEGRDSAVREVQAVVGNAGRVEVLNYEQPSYTGLKIATDKYYPTWVLPDSHPLVQHGLTSAAHVLGEERPSSKWVFSTNGVASMGKLHIPTIGFGPGQELHAHSVDDQIPIHDLMMAARFYAQFAMTW